MSLENHAERELKLAGIDQKDADYGGMLYDAVMELVKVFAKQGHSGSSASRTISLFEKVARYENLMPLTGKDEECIEVGESWGYSVEKPNEYPAYGVKYLLELPAGIDEEKIEVEAELLDLYALLVFTGKGKTTWEDVHNAWVIWRTHSNREHKSIVPFSELTKEVQEMDKEYADAINTTYQELNPTSSVQRG